MSGISFRRNGQLNTSIIVLLLAIIVVSVVTGIIAYGYLPQPKPITPTVTITLYGGEISSTKLGFGLSPTNLTSPGPALRFRTSDIVNMTLINVGQIPHSWVITSSNASSMTNPLFGAAIGSGSQPLAPGVRGSVVFAPTTAGTYYYASPVLGQTTLGMYGTVIVT